MTISPIYMLNALWFKQPDGEKTYQRYLKEASRVSKALGVGAKMLQPLAPQHILIGDIKPDLIFIVEYESRKHFDDFISSSEYQAIVHLREMSIEKSLLIQCSPYSFGNSE